MKKAFRKIVLVTFTLTSIISCSKEPQFNAARDHEKEFYDRVSAYADFHDDGLDFVYEQFTASANAFLSDTLEKVILVTMIRIGVNSAGYWQRGKIKWENLVNSQYGYNARGPGIDWKDVIFSDIIGAGGGAVKGAWVGFTGGTVAIPGVGTIGGTAVGGLMGMMGGAVVGSAGGVFWNYVKKGD